MKRTVDTSFWTDDKVMDIFSPEDRYFFLYLMTNPHTTQLGIYAINKKYIALETGYSIDSVKVLLDRFENKYDIIKYSEATSEVAIKNYLRHSIVKGGTPVIEQMKREIVLVKDHSLFGYVAEELNKHDNLSDAVKTILPIINAYASANAYAYAGTQGCTVERTDERTQITTEEPKKSTRFIVPSLEEIKSYCSERKNKVDAERFFDFYQSKGWMVGKNKMKDWKAAVRNWEKRDKDDQKVKKQDDMINHGYSEEFFEERMRKAVWGE